MPIEILPCAYCGSQPELITQPAERDWPTMYACRCVSGRCSGVASRMASNGITNWNKRQRVNAKVIQKASTVIPEIFAMEASQI